MLELSGRHSLPRTLQLPAVPRTLERKPVAKFQPPSTTPANQMLAEREGFEPSKGVNPYSLSRGAPSAARPPLRSVLNQTVAMDSIIADFLPYNSCVTTTFGVRIPDTR